MKTLYIKIALISNLVITLGFLNTQAQVLFNKSLQMMPASTADGEILDVSNFSLDGTIYLDGNAYVSNQGNLGTIKLGATGNTTSQGMYNIFIGTDAGKTISELNDGDNVLIGYQSHKNVGYYSFYQVMIGSQTGINNYNGSDHTFVGYQAGYSNYDGEHNTAFGYQAGYSNVAGDENTYFGANAGKGSIENYYTTAIGYNSDNTTTNCTYCTFIGVNADGASGATTGSTAIGYNAKVNQDYATVFGSTTDPIQVGINTATPRADLDVNTTGAIIIPVGQTMERPAVPVKGMIRFNSQTNHLEGYDGTAWINLD